MKWNEWKSWKDSGYFEMMVKILKKKNYENPEKKKYGENTDITVKILTIWWKSSQYCENPGIQFES